MWGKRVVRVLGLGCGAALALGLGGCGGDDHPLSGTVTGVAASATEQPLLGAWARRFERESGARVRLRAAGLEGVARGASDFGADEDAAHAAASARGGDLLGVPVALGEIAIAYNLVTFEQKRIPAGLHLDPHTIASIYLGPTFNWHQKVLLALNPGVDIPDELFEVCRHVGSSPATATFTAFLTRIAPKWARRIGAGAHVQWPRLAAPAAPTTDLAQCVKRGSGAIGYMSTADAERARLTTAAVQEAGGAFRAPGQPGYPIAAPLTLLVARDPCRAGRSREAAVDVKAWLQFALGEGQAMVRRAGYAPLPPALRTRARAAVAGLRCNGRAIAVPS